MNKAFISQIYYNFVKKYKLIWLDSNNYTLKDIYIVTISYFWRRIIKHR